MLAAGDESAGGGAWHGLELSQGRGFVARSRKGGMSRKGFLFDSSKFLGRKSPMCSVALNLLLCFDLLAKLHVVAKVFNLKEQKEQKE